MAINFLNNQAITGSLSVGSNTNGYDVTFFGDASGEFMQWDASAAALVIRHTDEEAGLGIFTNGGTQTTQPQFRVGRNTSEYWGVYTDDRNAHLVHRQDESTGIMTTRFDQWDNNTGDNTGLWLWRSGNASGASMLTALTLTQAGSATFAGNVGIGTTSPFTIGGTAKLSVYASGPSTFGLSSSDAVYLRRYGVGQYQFQTTANSGNTGDLSLQSYGGNVGIGTTSPGEKLHVLGKVLLNNGSSLYIDTSATQTVFANIVNIPMRFQTNSTNRFTIGGAGAIQFNNYDSTNNTGTPTYLLGTDASGNIVKTLPQGSGTAGPYLPLAGGTMTGDLKLNDDVVAKFGTGNDLRIQHTGNQSYIQNYTGDLQIQNVATDKDILFRADDGNGVVTSYLVLDGSTTHAYFSNPGNVGIGQTSPTAKLYVAGDTIVRGVLRDDNVNLGLGGAVKVKASNTASDQYVAFGTTPSGSSGAATFTEKMRVTSAGNVGIGTASPGGKLDIAYTGTGGSGTFGIGEGLNITSLTPNITFNDNSTSVDNYAIHLNQNVFTLGRYTSSTSQSPDLVLKSGNVGIGTTSPRGKLDVVGNTDNDSDFLTIQDDDPSAGSHRPSIRFRSNTAQIGQITGLDGRMIFSSGTTENSMLEILDNGNVGIGTTNPTAKLHVTGTGLFTGLVSGITPVAAANFVTKAYADAGNARVTPATPSTITSTIVGETIEIAFNQSSTSNIDYYQVWSSDDGGDYGIIAQITPADFSSTMTVVDTTFVTGGTMSYRVFAVREGIYSTAGTTSKAYTVSALSVTDMTVVNLNTAYYIQYEKPTSRFIDHVEIYMDSQTTSAALSRSNATIVYSGQNASYMRNVNTSSNFHQFWVEIVTS
jgi:hypothetical protein